MNTRITKTAVDPATARTPSFFYDSARAGMQDLLARRLEVEPATRVLLPSFIGWSPHEGSGVMDPVKALDLEPEFYALGLDLELDLADLEARLLAGGPAVVLLIHYFGRTQPALAAAADLVRRHGGILVEDLAHGFFSARTDGPAGTHGDVLLHSLHKMFPTPGALGGMMTYRDASLVTGQRSTRPDLAAFLLDYDWREIARRRRDTFARVADGLRELTAARQAQGREAGFELHWPELAPTDVPQTLPVRVLTADRNEVYRRMNEEGFGMVSLYHTLVPELRDEPVMAELARTIINFPVHQDVDPVQVADLVASFAAALDAGDAAAGDPQ